MPVSRSARAIFIYLPIVVFGIAVDIALATAQQVDRASTGDGKPPPNWIVNCPDKPKASQPDCRITQQLFLRETGQRLLSVVIEKRRKKPVRAIKLALPLGIYIPARVVLRVDKSKGPMRLGILTCDTGGCYTGAPIRNRFWRRLKKGKKLTVTFETAERKKIRVPVTLEGFDTANSKTRDR